ncbi:phosphonate C-P lyase system protein PhnH [Aquamicrobium sp. LC103]|uniref:phosphonate C-P lyase system protein PhnH n=1 Tax=Aquamicrobium sp. LC103 TaxID=1120658 RepID=UPI00069C6B8E|nr:phosphonate C-P lyase system protein PhnH [Aquamicrobium sp. LC103]TKT69850.1 phosphonate C-P lyase system protein PhnH [Aquamicrobium sp. LC103]
MEMIVPPRPDAGETRDNQTFEALMWAMSRPGKVYEIAEPGLLSVAMTLVDIEMQVYCDDSALAEAISRTGACKAAADEAGYLFVAGDPMPAIRTADPGTALYPDNGATIVIAASISGGPRLQLTGPGIMTTIEASPDLPLAFWVERARRSAYPAGLDLIIVEERRVIALPRSTQVEVL